MKMMMTMRMKRMKRMMMLMRMKKMALKTTMTMMMSRLCSYTPWSSLLVLFPPRQPNLPRHCPSPPADPLTAQVPQSQ
jgi:hypothetical protein